MLKEIRRIENRSKANYIRLLQYRGKIKQYISSKGYICYDTDELRQVQKTAKRGRPPKILKGE
jgi:hypothetical protein